MPIAAPTAVLPAVVLRPTTGMEQPALSVDRVYSCKKQSIPFWTIVVRIMPPIQVIPIRRFTGEAMPHFLTQSFASSSTY